MELKEFYSIKDIGQQTGFTPLRIRTWENRFALLSPSRTSTNIRQYKPSDVKKLLLIKDLLEKGQPISKLAYKTIDELSVQLKGYTTEAETDPHIQRFISTLQQMDEHKFHQVYDELEKTMRFEEIMEMVLFPLLAQVDKLWVNSGLPVCKEQFLANLVRQKVVAKTDSQRGRFSKNTTFLFTPEQEQHEIGLLYINYILKKNKFNCIYLGTGIDSHALKEIIGQKDFSNLITTVTTSDNLKSAPYFFKLLSNYGKRANVYIIGSDTLHKSKYLNWGSSYKAVLTQLGL